MFKQHQLQKLETELVVLMQPVHITFNECSIGKFNSTIYRIIYAHINIYFFKVYSAVKSLVQERRFDIRNVKNK